MWPFCHYDDTEVDWLRLPSAVVWNIGTFYRLFELRGSTVWWGDIFLCLSLFVFDFLWEKICHEATLQYLEGADIVIGGKVLFLINPNTEIQRHWKIFTVEVVRGKIKLLYDFQILTISLVIWSAYDKGDIYMITLWWDLKFKYLFTNIWKKKRSLEKCKLLLRERIFVVSVDYSRSWHECKNVHHIIR